MGCQAMSCLLYPQILRPTSRRYSRSSRACALFLQLSTPLPVQNGSHSVLQLANKGRVPCTILAAFHTCRAYTSATPALEGWESLLHSS